MASKSAQGAVLSLKPKFAEHDESHKSEQETHYNRLFHTLCLLVLWLKG